MAQIIDFTAGLRERRIESNPQIHERTEYRIEVNGRDISVYRSAVLGEWRWRTEDCKWCDDRFMRSGVGFPTATEAQQDAINQVAGMAGESPLFSLITGLIQAHDAAMGITKAEGEA